MGCQRELPVIVDAVCSDCAGRATCAMCGERLERGAAEMLGPDALCADCFEEVVAGDSSDDPDYVPSSSDSD